MLSKDEELANISKNYADIPPKMPFNRTKTDLSEYQIFDKSKISKEELDQYLEFCQDLFPCHEEETGILLSQKLNKMKALKFLHESKYNIVKAKFKLKYPIVFKFAHQNNIKLLLNYHEMAQILNEQISIDDSKFNQQESEVYRKVNEILIGNEQVTEKVFMELIALAKTQKVRLPPLAYEMEQNIILFNKSIQMELNQMNPNILQIKQILNKLTNFPVIPRLYDVLKQKLFTIEQVLFNVENFETVQEINLQKAFDLRDKVDELGIELDESNPKQKFFLEFTRDAREYVEQIDIILSGQRLKEKIKMNQLCQVMNFFTRHNIEQNIKLVDLLGYLEKNDRVKENCLMWAEDEKNMDQFHMINDLFASNIDYQNDVQYVLKKIDAIVIFKQIYDNIDNEQELFENIRKINDYKSKGYPWWTDQINIMEKICQGLKKVDDKVEEINKLNCTMDQFLFQQPTCLMNYDELKETVENQYLLENRSGYYLKIKDFIKDFQNFLQKCLENDCNNKEYFQKINKLLQYSIYKENEMDLIKKELLIRIKFDCQVYYFFFKVFKRDYEFYFKNYYHIFQDEIRDIVDIEQFCQFLEANYVLASKSVFTDQLKLFLERADQQELQDKIFNRNNDNNFNFQQSQISINSDFKVGQNNNQVYESPVIHQQNNHTNNNHINHNHVEQRINISLPVRESILSEPEDDINVHQPMDIVINKNTEADIDVFENWIANLNVFETYDQNIRKEFPLMQNLENQILQIKDDLNKSNQFNKDHLENINTLYSIASKTKIEIKQNLIEEFQKFVIHTPRQRNAVENYNKFLDIFKIYKKYSDFYEEYKNYKTDKYNFFALKQAFFCIIFYKLRIIGVEVVFLQDIYDEVQKNQKINKFLQFKKKQTVDQSLDIFNKLKFLQIYNHNYDFLKSLIKLYLNFEKVIYTINKRFNNYNFFKSQLQLEQDNEVLNYNMLILNSQIDLIRTENDIFDQLNAYEQQVLKQMSDKLYKRIPINIKLHDSLCQSIQNKNKCFCGQFCIEDDQQILSLSPCKTKCHRICLRILLKQQEKRVPCPACKYLEQSEDTEIQNLLTMKMTQTDFISLYKSYNYLKHFLVDINLSYVEIIHQQLQEIVNKIQNFQSQEIESKDNYLHDIALAYLLLPIRILSVELAFVGYIALMTYQTLMAHKKAEKNFLTSLKTFESSTKKKHPSMLPYVQKFSHYVQNNTEQFIKYLCYVTLVLCVISLLVCAQTTWLLGLLFLLENTVQRNFASLSLSSNSNDKIGFLLTVGVLGMSFFLSQNCATFMSDSQTTKSVQKTKTTQKRTATSPRRKRNARDQLINQK